MKQEVIFEFAKRNKVCPEWREFKAKWDGKKPRKGTAEYTEYGVDSARAKAAQEKILKEVIAELGE